MFRHHFKLQFRIRRRAADRNGAKLGSYDTWHRLQYPIHILTHLPPALFSANHPVRRTHLRLPSDDLDSVQRIRVAGFISVDEIRMLLKKIPSLIFLFNFYIYIILVLKINNSIISALKIMNLNILLLNFLKYSIAEYASKPCSECAWCKSGPVNVFPTSPHWRLCWERMYQYIPAILHCRKYWEDPAFFPGRNSDFQNSMGNLKL